MNLAIVGLLAQTEAVIETTNINEKANIISLVMNSDIVVQLTMLCLVIFSVVSWAIIGSKHRQLKQFRERSKRFYQMFWQAKNIDSVVAKGSFRKSPAFNVFKAAVDALRDTPVQPNQYYIQKEIKRATENEIGQMEYGISFLATTGSACPFIGLFGTVWGILNAFWKIGKTGASSIAIIGPYIAEALIATAVGLAAAIPAVIFYNFYTAKIRGMTKDITDFADDLNDRVAREYFNSVQ